MQIGGILCRGHRRFRRRDDRIFILRPLDPSPVSPASSPILRTTASASDSPGSTSPAGTDHSRRPAVPTRALDTADPVHAVQIGGKVPATGAERWLAVRRIIGFLFIALIVWLILTQPNTAANIVNDIFAILKTAATNVTSFFTQLLN
jgi:hypothetical protein